LPSLAEQKNIVEILTAFDSKIAVLEHEAILLEEFFRALLGKMMTGKLSTAGLIESEATA
jgi:restriction endonuclease S subunit